MLNVIILNVIFGVIVDTFGFLRDQNKVCVCAPLSAAFIGRVVAAAGVASSAKHHGGRELYLASLLSLNRIRLDAHPGDAGESGGHGRDMLHLQHGQEGVRPARRGVRAARGTRPGVGGTRITRRGSRSRARRFQRHVDLDHDK